VQAPLEPKEGNFPSRGMVIVLGAFMAVLSGFGAAYLKHKLTTKDTHPVNPVLDLNKSLELDKEPVLAHGN
jgi:hypothetical protein